MNKPFNTMDINLDAFRHLCSQEVKERDYPSAAGIEKKVVIYEGGALLAAMQAPAAWQKIKTEIYHCLKDGPGVFVIQGFYPDTEVVDRSSAIFRAIIEEEKALRGHGGDHFAKAGANERIWNSFQKVGERDPAAFIDYYKNALYELVSEAWLGPGYQITAQVNVVKPGGQAQSAHRDYHLGFQSDEVVSKFPLSLQIASQYLTLQGAIAHTDMPTENGPTLLLPFSQRYDWGYMAWRDPEFKAYFEQYAVQLPLRKGDALFFSPAVFHAAGTNVTEGDRMANLVQISAAFGKPMESIDRYRLMKLCYPVLLEKIDQNRISELEILAIVAAIADGYSFPTNLDVVPPIGGVAPETGQQLMQKALNEAWPVEQLQQAVDQHVHDRQA